MVLSPSRQWTSCSASPPDPGIVTGPIAPLAVDDGGGPAWGMTVVDLRSSSAANPAPGAGFAPWLVGQVADAPRFRSEVRRMLA